MTDTQARGPRRCANCVAILHGEYCAHCGQAAHETVRHLPALFEDVVHSVLHIDHRIARTLPALLLRPGFLCREYLAGRRARYIPPFRLMFVLSALAFLFIQINLGHAGVRADQAPRAFRNASTPAQVQAQLGHQLAELDAAARSSSLAGAGLEPARHALQDAARARLAELAAPAGTKKADTVAGIVAQGRKRIASAGTLERTQDALGHALRRLPSHAGADRAAARASLTQAAGERMQALRALDNAPLPADQQIHARWLPRLMESGLNDAMGRIRAHWRRLSGDSHGMHLLVRGIFSVLPQTMLVLIPVFALLLKLAYLFQRRLYMEHMIVALYSHAFMFLILLLLAWVDLLHGWLVPHAAWLGAPINLLSTVLWLWLPVYLLLMQKRIYAQGWPMTAIKYAGIGTGYGVLLGLALAAATLITLAH